MHWPSFFSWKPETVLFFLKEKEKNGFGKLQLIIDIRRNIPDIILQSGC